jgi:hypothetical protein
MYSRNPRAYAETDILLDQLERMPHVCRHCAQDDEEALTVGSTSGEIMIECKSERACAIRKARKKSERDASNVSPAIPQSDWRT